jgi:hypothetical protein
MNGVPDKFCVPEKNALLLKAQTVVTDFMAHRTQTEIS